MKQGVKDQIWLALSRMRREDREFTTEELWTELSYMVWRPNTRELSQYLRTVADKVGRRYNSKSRSYIAVWKVRKG